MMLTESETTRLPPISTLGAFVKGFLIRLLYGSLAVPFLAWLHPEFLGEAWLRLLTTFALFSMICVAGGIYDASTRDTRRIRLFQRPSLLSVVYLVFLVVVLWLNH